MTFLFSFEKNEDKGKTTFMLRPIADKTFLLFSICVLLAATPCPSQQQASQPLAAPLQSPSQSEQRAGTSNDPPLAVALNKIEEESKALQASESLDDATKEELLKRYKAASEWLVSARGADTKTAQYVADIKNAPAAQQLKDELALPQADPDVQLAKDISLPQLEQLAADAEARLSVKNQTPY